MEILRLTGILLLIILLTLVGSKVVYKDRYATITGTITITNGSGSVNFNYPEGFTQENCVPIAGGTTFNSQNQIAFGQALSGSILTGVRLNASSITFSTGAPSGTGPSGTYSCKVVLMRTD